MRYQWQIGNSPIQEVTITGGKKALPEALIFAPNHIDTTIANLHKILVSKGMHIAYDLVDNRPVLRVGGFSKESDIIHLLQKNNLVSGNSKVEAITETKQPFDKFIGAALFYQIGNITGWIGDFLRKDTAGVTSNTAFIVGDSTILLFGRKTIAEKQTAIMQNFGEALQKNGISISASSPFAPHHTQDLSGVWNSVRRFMANKVVGIKAASEIVAGVKKAQAGFFNQGNFAKGMAGVMIAGGFAAGSLIPEKTPAELRDEYDVKTDAELKAKIKELPLGKRILTTIQRTPLLLAGGSSGLNNLFSIIGAIDEKNYYKQHNESRKRTEVCAKIEGGSYETNTFGFKKKHTINDDSPDPDKWTQRKKVHESGLACREDRRGLKRKHHLENGEGADHYQSVEILSEHHKQLKAMNDLVVEKDRLATGRFNFPIGRFWIFDIAQAFAFFIANILYASSPKGGNMADRNKLADVFFSAVASQIATAPNNQKDYLFSVASQYAGDTHDLGLTVREAQIIISKKLKEIQANPWLQYQLESSKTPLLTTAIAHQEESIEKISEKPQRPSYSKNLTKYKKPEAPISLIDRAAPTEASSFSSLT